ncbi:ImmA/IrrE family metallo-endopeptidase [Saprospiraceae bacterium]|nr:ImmA/IrrE family metallo-endopeptidase [Saprospiraceae bacterium]MDC3210021.1 ImmA/IrrE family metallo-endopeptidase [Saprospiraceae bacterium]
MSIKTQNHRIIFGLKVKQLRTGLKLSFAQLAEQSGLSVSYLNEIEKGKKYPRADKIALLAKALKIDVESLTSTELMKQLAPVGVLLQSNFLNELPLDLFGIELSKVTEIIANAPIRVGAFISTLVEISRSYALLDAHFFTGAMRAYQEMRYNYFEEIEKAVDDFFKKDKLPFNGTTNSDTLKLILQKKYKYQVIENGLSEFPELKDIRAVFIPKRKKLLLNENLSSAEKLFQLAKELGFNRLKIKQRGYTSSLLKIDSFDMVLNQFQASYFAAALIIPREALLEDLTSFFQKERWDAEALIQINQKYNASPEILYHRLTNLLPQFFDLQKLFFLRCIHNTEKNNFEIDKELHLNHKHHPHGNGLLEHYCRRWLSISLLDDMHKMQKVGKYINTFVGIQRSKYYGTDDEYLSFTLSRPAHPQPHLNTSVTIGILIDNEVREKINFLDDPTIRTRVVNKTCERCPVKNCEERAAPAIEVKKRENRKAVQNALKKLIGD